MYPGGGGVLEVFMTGTGGGGGGGGAGATELHIVNPKNYTSLKLEDPKNKKNTQYTKAMDSGKLYRGIVLIFPSKLLNLLPPKLPAGLVFPII